MEMILYILINMTLLVQIHKYVIYLLSVGHFLLCSVIIWRNSIYILVISYVEWRFMKILSRGLVTTKKMLRSML